MTVRGFVVLAAVIGAAIWGLPVAKEKFLASGAPPTAAATQACLNRVRGFRAAAVSATGADGALALRTPSNAAAVRFFASGDDAGFAENDAIEAAQRAGRSGSDVVRRIDHTVVVVWNDAPFGTEEVALEGCIG
jgi:hypothetical protein